MNKQYQSLMKIVGWAAMLLFVGQWVVFPNEGATVFLLIRYAVKAAGLAALLATVYERWGWKYNPLEKTPKLHNIYKGIIKSTYDGIERDATIQIKQTLLSVSVVLITNESKSSSISASICEVLGEQQLLYNYLNTPKSEFRDRSEVHFGTAILYLTDIKRITGRYYTDRNTKGDMVFDAEYF